MFKSLRTAFVTGIFVFLPLGVTVILLYFLLNRLGEPLSEVFFGFLSDTARNYFGVRLLLSAVSIVIVSILITLLGYASRYVLGRFFIQMVQRTISTVPFLKSVYSTVEQIVHMIREQNKSVFSKVVLVPFPQKGSYAIGFEASRTRSEISTKADLDAVYVFIPATPNPTSGFLIVFPASDIITLDMSVSEAMKLILSCGAIHPTAQG